jgi:hypothetical protein
VAAFLLKLKHHLTKALVRDLVPLLLFMRLGNLVVLAVDASEVAVTEEDIAGPMRAYQRRLFAEVRRIGRNYRQPARIAACNLILHTVVTAIERANGAALKELFERANAALKFARIEQLKVFRLFSHGV